MAYGITLSRLIHLVEDAHTPLVRAADQPTFADPSLGYTRRVRSPPARTLRAEVIEVTLQPGAAMNYGEPTEPGAEHHVMVREGALTIRQGGEEAHLHAGDTLRYSLAGPSAFLACPQRGARSIVVIVP